MALELILCWYTSTYTSRINMEVDMWQNGKQTKAKTKAGACIPLKIARAGTWLTYLHDFTLLHRQNLGNIYMVMFLPCLYGYFVFSIKVKIWLDFSIWLWDHVICSICGHWVPHTSFLYDLNLCITFRLTLDPPTPSSKFLDFSRCSWYRHRTTHKRLYMFLSLYSQIQVLPDITSCRLMKNNNSKLIWLVY